MYVELTFTDSIDEDTRNEITGLTGNLESLEQLLEEWFFKPNQSLHFTPAEDDDGNFAPELLCVEFIKNKQTQCYAFFEKEDFESNCPDVLPISEYICGFGERGNIELDEDALKRWEDSLGFTFSEAFMNSIGPRHALIPFILTYILSDGGYIELEKGHESHYDEWDDLTEDLKEEGLTLSEIIATHAGYRSPEPIDGILPGWGTFAYFKA